jgi:predicted peptidase
MNRRFPIAVAAAGGLLAGSAGVVVAGSSGATTPEDTVEGTSVAASLGTVADTGLAQFATGSSQRLTARPAGTTDAALGYFEYLPPDYDDDESSPLLVFLHGYGASGDGSAAGLFGMLHWGDIPDLIWTDRWPSKRPFVMLAPQHAFLQDEAQYVSCDGVAHYGSWGSCIMRLQHERGHPDNDSICFTPNEVHEFLSYALASYDVDPDRVYLTGLSCGAYGAWEYVAEYGGSQIAAMVPIAGDGRPAWEAAQCRLGEVAIWAFHGDADDVVAAAGSSEPITNLSTCPQPRRDAELTVYPGVDHDSWTRTYFVSRNGPDIYEWLLGFTVSGWAVAGSSGTTTPEHTVA